jgi:hypothetical protein
MSADRPDAAVQARLLRAKARLAAGDRGAANKGLLHLVPSLLFPPLTDARLLSRTSAAAAAADAAADVFIS